MQSINDEGTVLGIFLDLRKAFDVENHVILWKKLQLHEYGVRGVVYDWFVSYLCERSRYTAHKKFMNSFGCHGYDPYGAIISTGQCQKTFVYKSARLVLF